MKSRYTNMIFIFTLTLVHSVVYRSLDIMFQNITSLIYSSIILVTIGLSTFISFILYYNTISILLKDIYRKVSFNKFLIIFKSFIIYFNILAINFFIPGIIYLVSTLVLYQIISKNRK